MNAVARILVLLFLLVSGAVRPQESEPTELLGHYDPAWSPDGTQIAFSGYGCTSGEDCNSDIYVIGAEGEGLTNLTGTPNTSEYLPTWSPSRSSSTARIAFIEKIDEKEYGIFVVNVRSRDRVQLGSYPQDLVNHPSNGNVFDWSPDGQQIVFVTEFESSYHLFLINIDGTGLRRLTAGSADHVSPDWSPDGRRIAFALTENGNSDVGIINVDGTNQQNLTGTEQHQEFLPAWSPDGQTIMFPMLLANQLGFGLSIMNADGSARTVLVDHLGGVYPPWIRWSPDGEQVAFSLVTGMMTHILIVSADGSSTLWLTEDLEARNSSVSWAPDGTRLAFTSDIGMDYHIYTIKPNGTDLLKITGQANP